MGWAYTSLIAPAILHMYPGVNREEFAELLGQTRSSSVREYDSEDPWDSHEEFDIDIFDKGLKSVASVLSLKYTQKYINFQKDKIDKNGLELRSPYLLSLSKNKTPYKFEVGVNLENKFEEPKIIEKAYAWKELSVGDYWADWYESGRVKKIFSGKRIREDPEEDEDDDFEVPDPTHLYHLEVEPWRRVYKEEKFLSEEKLYEKYPLFDPRKKYNWSKKGDSFKTGVLDFLAPNRFFWRQEDGKYYLDEKTFNKIKASGFGYTDLILTAEAIKNKAWKLLSYKGFKHIEDFLGAFPSAKIKYDQAVWNSHTSLFAKELNLSVNDFLRMRIMGFYFLNK